MRSNNNVDAYRYRQVRSGMMSSRNALIQKLERSKGGSGRHMTGSSLIGSELPNTYIRSMIDQSHPRAFWSAFTEKSVRACATVCLDVSGSMGSNLCNIHKYTEADLRKRSVKRSISAMRGAPDTVWTETVYACAVAKEIFSGLGIPFQVALGQYSSTWEGGNIHTPLICSRFEDRAMEKETVAKLLNYRCNTGTDIAGYAEVTVDMIKARQEDIKLAFFMTDGCCPRVTAQRLSLYTNICKVKGITLIPIVFGRSAGLPNEISVLDAIDFGKTFVEKLLSILP